MIDKAGNASNIIRESIVTADERRAHNYPNPFNPNVESTTIVFYLSSNDTEANIDIYIYDLFGNLVLKKGCSGHAGVNDHVKWDGLNGAGIQVADGGYICVIKAGKDVISKHKMAVVK
jgi:flagellar hook assembly protein FlgD